MDVDIDKIAKMAMLSFSPEQKAALAKQMPALLEYVGKLQEVDTSQVDGKAYLGDLKNVWREDIAAPVSESTHEALVKAFPKTIAGALEVPGVFE
jgi:aspartyl-tRNA(Asn)/glutamyl-tRNA(Gln) amidotransferase subunit C